MALADDELTVGKNHAHNGEWIEITMRKVNILLSMYEDVWKWISDKRTKNQAKTDKTKHGMEKHGKDKVKSKSKSRSHQVKENTTLRTKFAKS
ncbi:hypothetical protein Tco_1190637 [Tanacetum coccineum]